MGVVRVKPGVEFSVIAPGGFRILAAIDDLAATLPQDLTITSGTDGEHSGPDDPHHRGEAYDVRSHDLDDKNGFVLSLQERLGAVHFYAFLENPNMDSEHIHAQVRKGTTYP